LPLQLQGQGLDALGRHRFGQWRQGGAGHGEWGGMEGSTWEANGVVSSASVKLPIKNQTRL